MRRITVFWLAVMVMLAPGVRAEEPIATDCPETFLGKWYPHWTDNPGGDFGPRVLGGIEIREDKFISEVQGEFNYRALPTPTNIKRLGFDYLPEPKGPPYPRAMIIELDRPFSVGYFKGDPSRHLVFITMYDHPQRYSVVRCPIAMKVCLSEGDALRTPFSDDVYCDVTTFVPRHQAGGLIIEKSTE